jgi:hypothetical protein
MSIEPIEVVWTLARQDQRLSLHRERTECGFWLIEDRPGAGIDAYFFPDIASLIRQETDLVTARQQDGWSLIEFSPERRSGVDRRQEARGPDRRQWVWQRL